MKRWIGYLVIASLMTVGLVFPSTPTGKSLATPAHAWSACTDPGEPDDYGYANNVAYMDETWYGIKTVYTEYGWTTLSTAYEIDEMASNGVCLRRVVSEVKSNKPTLALSAHVRWWICGVYQGENINTLRGGYELALVDSGWHNWGSCGIQGDNHIDDWLFGNTEYTAWTYYPAYCNSNSEADGRCY